MCDEERIAAQLRRNSGEEITASLKRDIEAFFTEKYGISCCDFRLLVPQSEDMARVDFTVQRGSDFTRRYVGTAGYVEGHLSLGKIVRLM